MGMKLTHIYVFVYLRNIKDDALCQGKGPHVVIRNILYNVAR